MYIYITPWRCELFELCQLVLRYFPLQPFQSVHRENKFCVVLNKDPVTKISSTEFAVFGQALPEYSFRENFCP